MFASQLRSVHRVGFPFSSTRRQLIIVFLMPLYKAASFLHSYVHITSWWALKKEIKWSTTVSNSFFLQICSATATELSTASTVGAAARRPNEMRTCVLDTASGSQQKLGDKLETEWSTAAAGGLTPHNPIHTPSFLWPFYFDNHKWVAFTNAARDADVRFGFPAYTVADLPCLSHISTSH